MTTIEEQPRERGAVSEHGEAADAGRRELKDWQAQLIALAITLGITATFVVLFSLVTGSL